MVKKIKINKELIIFIIQFILILFAQITFLVGKNQEVDLVVSGKFKQELQKRVDKDITFIQRLIKEGEDEETKADFLKLLDEQKKWFTLEIEKMTQFFDQSYDSVIKKSDRFNSLVSYQKQADELLAQNMINFKIKINKALYKRIRLVLFYEINSMVQSGLSNIPEKIEKIIIDLLKQLLDTQKINLEQITEPLKGPEIKDQEKMKEKVQEKEKVTEQESKKSTLKQIEALEKNLAQIKESLKKDFETQITEKNKKNLDLEISLMKEKQILEEKNKEVENLKNSIKVKEDEVNKLKQDDKFIDTKNKEVEALKTSIKSKEEEVNKLKQGIEASVKSKEEEILKLKKDLEARQQVNHVNIQVNNLEKIEALEKDLKREKLENELKSKKS